jgi:hypothetical protein
VTVTTLPRRSRSRKRKVGGKLKGHDEAITAILSAIRELMNPPAPKRRGIGFTADLEKTK